jgi:hypothetical protein
MASTNFANLSGLGRYSSLADQKPRSLFLFVYYYYYYYYYYYRRFNTTACLQHLKDIQQIVNDTEHYFLDHYLSKKIHIPFGIFRA